MAHFNLTNSEMSQDCYVSTNMFVDICLINVSVCIVSYPASEQQPSAVSCSVVCEAYSDAIFGQLVRVSSTHDVVSFNLCIGNLERSERKE